MIAEINGAIQVIERQWFTERTEIGSSAASICLCDIGGLMVCPCSVTERKHWLHYVV